MTDQALERAVEIVRSCMDIMRPGGMPAVDFQDERSLFLEGKLSITGVGEAAGPNRAIVAAEAALADLLLSLKKR